MARVAAIRQLVLRWPHSAATTSSSAVWRGGMLALSCALRVCVLCGLQAVFAAAYCMKRQKGTGTNRCWSGFCQLQRQNAGAGRQSRSTGRPETLMPCHEALCWVLSECSAQETQMRWLLSRLIKVDVDLCRGCPVICLALYAGSGTPTLLLRNRLDSIYAPRSLCKD